MGIAEKSFLDRTSGRARLTFDEMLEIQKIIKDITGTEFTLERIFKNVS
jgi:hypothetical protein